MASLTAEGDTVSKMESEWVDRAQTLEYCDDLGLRLLWSQPIQEEVDVRSRKGGSVEVFAKGPLGGLVGIRDWEKAGQNRSTSGDNIIPVEE